MKFVKMNVGGNDFILIDNRRKEFNPRRYSSIARELSNRRFSIGADGVIFLENSKIADIKMSFYNCDGSRPEMCGNGIRCLAYFAKLLRIIKKKVKIETDIGIFPTYIENSLVRVEMLPPTEVKLGIRLGIDKEKFTVHAINTGVPHAIIFTNDIENIDIQYLGSKIRHHPTFAPNGTNVDFVKTSRKELMIRTYERGVEGETLSCGTGVVAAAAISGILGIKKPPIICRTMGGEKFKIYFKIDGKEVKDVCLESKVSVNFYGWR